MRRLTLNEGEKSCDTAIAPTDYDVRGVVHDWNKIRIPSEGRAIREG